MSVEQFDVYVLALHKIFKHESIIVTINHTHGTSQPSTYFYLGSCILACKCLPPQTITKQEFMVHSGVASAKWPCRSKQDSTEVIRWKMQLSWYSSTPNRVRLLESSLLPVVKVTRKMQRWNCQMWDAIWAVFVHSNDRFTPWNLT